MAVANAAEALKGWREAERLLQLVPEDAPERADAELVVVEFRNLYQRLVARVGASEARLDESLAELERAEALLQLTRARLERSRLVREGDE